jgi:hypothetical protein
VLSALTYQTSLRTPRSRRHWHISKTSPLTLRLHELKSLPEGATHLLDCPLRTSFSTLFLSPTPLRPLLGVIGLVISKWLVSPPSNENDQKPNLFRLLSISTSKTSAITTADRRLPPAHHDDDQRRFVTTYHLLRIGL